MQTQAVQPQRCAEGVQRHQTGWKGDTGKQKKQNGLEQTVKGSEIEDVHLYQKYYHKVLYNIFPFF